MPAPPGDVESGAQRGTGGPRYVALTRSARHPWRTRGLAALLAALAAAAVATYSMRQRRATATSYAFAASSHVEDAVGLVSSDACSAGSENCLSSRCCKDPGMACYEKNPAWYGCRSSCVPGVDPNDTEEDPSPWSCARAPARAPPAGPAPRQVQLPALGDPGGCSGEGQNCADTKCCMNPALRCYEKHPGWYACKRICVPGIDADEPTELQTPWSCALPPRGLALGPAPYEREPDADCSDDGHNCTATGCCRNPAARCYEKQPGWGACRRSCVPGLDFDEPVELRTPWTCKLVARPAPTTAAPSTTAAATTTSTKTTTTTTSQASTATSTATSTKTPTTTTATATATATTSSTTLTTSATTATSTATTTTSTTPTTTTTRQCAKEGRYCLRSRCCSNPGFTCFEKHLLWAVCRKNCTPGVDRSQPRALQTPWSCKVATVRR